jgi:esterase/lipase superfamily enzyme
MPSFPRRLVPFVGALMLGACAEHPHGVLEPVLADTPGTSHVNILVATTRSADKSPGIMFNGLRANEIGFADIDVSLPPDGVRKPGEVQWPSALPGNPATDFVTRRTSIIDRVTALAVVHDEVRHAPKKQVLVFVHGFNNRFEDAVYRFAQIVHDSGTEAVPVLFTWPSKASVLAYGYDRESSTYSRTQLENVLKGLVVDPQVGEISILAHSMGNWLALESLRQMAIREGGISPKIKNVLLAAPDVDIDIAREQIDDMGPRRPAFSLFVSRSDKALEVSKTIWGSTARLGDIDPQKEPYKAMLERDKIAVYDLTALNTPGGLNHSTFATSPEIVGLIGARLASGQALGDDKQRFSDTLFTKATGAVSGFGDAAGLIVSAPAAAIDADSRDTYGERFRTFGGSLLGQ